MIFTDKMTEEEKEEVYMLYSHSYRPASEDYEMVNNQ